VAPATPAPTDLSALTSVVLLRTLAQLDSGLLHSPTSPRPSAFALCPSTTPAPQTPIQQVKCRDTTTASSPPIPSPSQLVRYLQYAETNLGVRHALSFKSALDMNGIGPDIFPDVDDKLLSDLGISAGDAIRLKKGSTAWWNGLDAKRKRSNTSASAASETNCQQPPKRVSYEKRYHEGGGCRFHAPPMKKDDEPSSPVEHDFDLFYQCETLKQWLPVPYGYSVDEDAEINDNPLAT